VPLKPHPTDPDKMVFVKSEYNLPKEWVGLTEDDLQTIFQCLCISGASFNTIALAVEAKLKEKNT